MKKLLGLLIAALLLASPAHAARSLKDITCETTATTGTGTLNLAGALTNYLAFVTQVTSGDTVSYNIVSGDGKVETGVGVFTDASPDTLTRASSIVSTDGVGTKLTLSGTSTVCLGFISAWTQPNLGTGDSPTFGGATFTGNVAGGANVATFGTFEPGNTTDTTISRLAAGVGAVEGDPIVTGGSLPIPHNLGLAVSAGSSALTIALKGADGNDPSASNPVYVPFRDTTGTTGTPSWLAVTAATSLVISSGSTMGVTSSTAFRIWIVGFNDAGTFRLGAINASTCSTTACTITPLTLWRVASSTAEGGAGAADSQGVFYTGSAVTSKAYAVLGFAEWSSSGLTAGTWTTTNLTKVQVYGPGVPLPGAVVQANEAITTPSASTNSTSFVTTGTSLSLTPTSAANPLKVTTIGFAFTSASAKAATYQISRGTTNNTNMVGSLWQLVTVSGGELDVGVVLQAWDLPNTTISQSYAVQYKTASSSTNTWGNSNQTLMSIEEIMG